MHRLSARRARWVDSAEGPRAARAAAPHRAVGGGGTADLARPQGATAARRAMPGRCTPSPCVPAPPSRWLRGSTCWRWWGRTSTPRTAWPATPATARRGRPVPLRPGLARSTAMAWCRWAAASARPGTGRSTPWRPWAMHSPSAWGCRWRRCGPCALAMRCAPPTALRRSAGTCNRLVTRRWTTCTACWPSACTATWR